MKSINRELSNSIKESKWCSIEYQNKNDERTNYWIYILDVNPKERTFHVQMYNHAKGENVLNAKISYDKILSAQMLDFTCGAETLLDEKIRSHVEDYHWLEYEKFNKNILSYLLECNRLDENPSETKYGMVSGIDYNVLRTKKHVVLTPEQIDEVISIIYQDNIKRDVNEYNEFAISLMSIDEGKKKYIFAYQKIAFSPKDKSLSLDGPICFNQTFMQDGVKHSIFTYTEKNAEEFQRFYLENPIDAEEEIRNNLRHGEQFNTRPDIFVLKRKLTLPLAATFEKIEQDYHDNCLEKPMRAFFGDLTIKDKGRSRPKIIVYNKKVNADQLVVIYDSMKNNVTYVQGPPGTGKTQTLFNVILSAYYNDRTVLVSTGNNIPLNGIVKLLHFPSKWVKEVPFPFLRLGNRAEVAKATLKIRHYFNTTFKGEPDKERLDNIKYIVSRNNRALIDHLTSYQKKKQLIQQRDFLLKIGKGIHKENARFKTALTEIEAQIRQLPNVNNEMLIQECIPVGEDNSFSQYIYFDSLAHLRRLKGKAYDELRSIVMIDDEEDRCIKFNKYIADDENLELLTRVFPIIFTTNHSSGRLGTGDFKFDMAIMDEAGQCNLASSLIPISKAKSLLLVGDEDQLQPITQILPETNLKLRKKYNISDEYDYRKNSIISTMKTTDNVSSHLLLTYHYRCGKRIIDFSNQYFYDGKLHIDPSTGPGNIEFTDCKNNISSPQKNTAYEEAKIVVDYVKKLGLKDTCIITPFKNQEKCINDLLDEEGIKEVRAATIHSMQGAEANNIILSAAVNGKTSLRTMEWLNENKEIVNVAVSRAKKNLIICADAKCIQALSKKDSIWYSLVEYAKSNGTE